MSKNRMQNLILEVLNSQPSLRDSKQYLKSFGPKNLQQQQGGRAFFDPSVKAQRLKPPSTTVPRQPRASVVPPPTKPSYDASDSHVYPDSHVASTSKTRLHSSDQGAPASSANVTTSGEEEAKDGTQSYLESSHAGSDSQQHTALVKIQGPFTHRQLESIADGMIYLKKLGLVSIIVVDGEEWSQPGFAAEFTPEGEKLDAWEEQEDKELAPWSGPRAAEARRAETREIIRQRQISLRRTMLDDVTKLADLLQAKGAPARPFLGPLFRVDGQAAKEAEKRAPRHFPGAEPSTSSGVASGAVVQELHPSSPAFGYRQMRASPCRAPLVSDDNLYLLRSALATDHIPILAPLALYADPESEGGERFVPVKADDVLVALARDMAMAGQAAEEALLNGQLDDVDEWQSMTAQVDMMPLRLMVINREGGIPSHARGGNPHLAINLASEYSHILHSFIWEDSHPTALSNLQMVHDCLSYMPHTSSGIVVSHRSPRSLIANLITNKAAHSPSLPHSLLASRKDVRHTPTIIRPGLSIHVIQDFNTVDKKKLTALLESSFRKELDQEAYYKRLEENCEFVIVTGDYQGAAIVTRERPSGSSSQQQGEEGISYLDKFAVLPQLQGSGTVDFLWGALRDEVQGLGLLDALNDNGGKGGFGKGQDLVWKSRADNPVNRWYYERSNGFVKIDTRSDSEKKIAQEALAAGKEVPAYKEWVLFWCDAEDRLSEMSGERRLSARASEEDVRMAVNEAAAVQHHQPIRRGGSSSSRDGRYDDSNHEEEEDDEGYSTSRRRPYSGLDSYHRSRRNALASPSSGGSSATLSLQNNGSTTGPRLLPVIAPEERGRLEKWVQCMKGIPSAWK